MSGARFLADEKTFLIQAGFVFFSLFLAGYSIWHRWWVNTYARALWGVAASYVGVTLYQVLLYWHVLQAESNDVWAWVSVQARLIAPVCGAMLTWQILRPHLRALHRKLRGEPPPEPLRRYPAVSPLTVDAEGGTRRTRRSSQPPSARSTRSPAEASPPRRRAG